MRVKIIPNPQFDPLGVRLLLSSFRVGVQGPMLQDESGITCVMSQQQIDAFRNGPGAAHQVIILPEVAKK